MKHTIYHLGGSIPSAPAGNRAEELDGDGNTYTRWDKAGTVLEQRALVAEESVRLNEQEERAIEISNATSLPAKARQALSSNSTFLALPSPNAAQNAAQIKSLTRQVNALIRLQIREFGDVSDT